MCFYLSKCTICTKIYTKTKQRTHQEWGQDERGLIKMDLDFISDAFIFMRLCSRITIRFQINKTLSYTFLARVQGKIHLMSLMWPHPPALAPLTLSAPLFEEH